MLNKMYCFRMFGSHRNTFHSVVEKQHHWVRTWAIYYAALVIYKSMYPCCTQAIKVAKLLHKEDVEPFVDLKDYYLNNASNPIPYCTPFDFHMVRTVG